MALISVFKNFTPVVDKVEQVLGGLKAIIDEVINRWVNFATGYLKFITGNFKEGMNQMKQSFDGVTESIKGAYNAGVELAKLQQDLDDRNRGIAISNAKAEASINRLIIASKNRTRTEQERLNMLDQAESIAKKQFETENKLVEDNYKLSIEKAKLKTKLTEDEILQLAEGTLAQEIEYAKRGNLDDELLKEIADNRVKVIELEGKTNGLLEKINNQRDKLQEAADEKDKKATEAKIKRMEEVEKARQEMMKREIDAINNTNLLRIQLMADGINKEIEQIEFDTQRKIEALVGSEQQIEEQRALLKELERQRINEATDAWEAQIMADAKAFSDEMQAQEMAEANESWAREKARLDKEKKAIQEKHDFEVALEQERMAMAQQAVSFFTDMLASQVKNEAAQKRIRKMGAVAEIGINLFRELSANATYAANLGPGGPAYLALKNPPAYLRAAFATGRVLAFKKGGILRGPSHRDGGIDMMVRGRVAANAEGGEPILTAGVSRNPRLLAAASQINVMAGGRPLMEMGGVVPSNPYAEVRNITANSSQNALRSGSDSQDTLSIFRMELQAEREAMLAKMTSLRVVNDPTDTQRELDVINEIQSRVNV
ncbi:MAG: hypothetical protein O9340_04490 [Cyclobacteriaceae bacterium]|nr:hypothetical protein [Cyclobacteriaceae bacterium]